MKTASIEDYSYYLAWKMDRFFKGRNSRFSAVVRMSSMLVTAPLFISLNLVKCVSLSFFYLLKSMFSTAARDNLKLNSRHMVFHFVSLTIGFAVALATAAAFVVRCQFNEDLVKSNRIARDVFFHFKYFPQLFLYDKLRIFKRSAVESKKLKDFVLERLLKENPDFAWRKIKLTLSSGVKKCLIFFDNWHDRLWGVYKTPNLKVYAEEAAEMLLDRYSFLPFNPEISGIEITGRTTCQW